MKNIITKSDAQLVATVARVSEEKAQYMIREAGGLIELLQANNAAITSAFELSRRAMESHFRRTEDVINSPAVTKRFLQYQYLDEMNEVFGVVFLDTRHRVITFEKMFRGTIDGASVHPRAIVKRALDLNAAAIILSHNHPSGVADASVQDERITKTLSQALQLIDVRVLDHVIVAACETFSFAERGLI